MRYTLVHPFVTGNNKWRQFFSQVLKWSYIIATMFFKSHSDDDLSSLSLNGDTYVW